MKVKVKIIIDSDKLKVLREELAGQSLKKVAKRCKKSEQAVRDTLRGDTYNENTIKELIKHRDRLKHYAQQLSNKI